MRRSRVGKFILAALFVVGYMLAFAAPAGAQSLPEASQSVVVGGEHIVTIPIAMWNLVVGGLLPFLTSLLVKLEGRAGVKIVINALLSAVSGLVGTAIVADGTAVLSSTSIVNALLAFFISTLAYVNLYKKVHVPEALPGTNKGFG